MSKDMSPSTKNITVGQAGKFSDVLIAALSKSRLPSKETQDVLEKKGKEIANECVAIIRCHVEEHIRATEPYILKRQEFDPVEFIGKNWSIDEQLGQRTGDNLDAGKIINKDYLKKNEFYTEGKEWLKRIKKVPKDVQLDANDFLALWQEKGHETLNWLYETKGIIWLSFCGTILRNQLGNRGVLDLYRGGEGSWHWSFSWLGFYWRVDRPAGLLASSN
ncbi:MAG: hypothetical protein COU22_03215 [Candidatus Komeilibacteria bacterium CG10_big_fil_rev_8_21_14_0_10_41_13]|uniref:Uncharacterized protein n=1 Tax=Candidatus Komeilibacteria bacterium CG10_big_fil_rev_8_21_14_0_10_41_13 TaxID=1974476 RepID=A0A2M6WC27_9BACT|nr:MAG: hypothetical protein COU22_03215 [Candidatus Komeilibacteria bacterium CG10_big_fil_rev_8_21_14_0_10_41_13]